MRLLVIIGFSMLLVSPASAVEKATVAQVEQLLAEHASKSRPAKPQPRAPDEVAEIENSDILPAGDDSVPLRLSDIELTDRMSTLTLYRLVGQYKLGARAQTILQQMADRSALLRLPSGEEIPLAAPDADKQYALFNAARDYVFGKLSHLPDFVALRTTTKFDSTPAPLNFLQAGDAGYHRRDIVQKEITFRDGKEVLASAPGKGPDKSDDASFESHGEFGTEAAVVLMDIERGTVAFDHWEDTMGGVAAVYRYSVPRAASHYEVTGRCEEHGSFHNMPGYHGTIALSPQNGAILRMTLEAELERDDPVSHVASVIEYGPVLIGNRRSICPLRSLAFMVQETKGCTSSGHKLQKPVALVNRTIFSNYHRFGSSSTMIFDETQSGDPLAGVSRSEDDRQRDPVPPANSKTITEHRKP